MAERIERLRHLFPLGTSITERYINPRRGGSQFKRPTRSRATHGQRIYNRLDTMRQQAVELGRQRLAFGLDADESIMIEFVGKAGHELAVRSLESAGQGIELLVA